MTGRDAPPGLAAVLEEHLRGVHRDVEAGFCGGGQEKYPLLVGVE